MISRSPTAKAVQATNSVDASVQEWYNLRNKNWSNKDSDIHSLEPKNGRMKTPISISSVSLSPNGNSIERYLGVCDRIVVLAVEPSGLADAYQRLDS
jgi:hypothetical protein